MEHFGPYALLEPLGRGGMAEVFLARVTGPLGVGRFVALKRVPRDVSSELGLSSMFVDEARLSVRLVHPNIISVHEFGREDGCFFLAMEYVAGHDLKAIMARAASTGVRLGPECALFITTQVARALHYAHLLGDARGRPFQIVHRDVTPPNILLSYGGDVKLTDFGIARAAGFLRLDETRSGALKGTPRYMSPEQAGGAVVDARSDQFSLGTVLLEMMTLQRAFWKESAEVSLALVREARAPERREFAHLIPKDVGRIIDRAMALDPYERFPDAGELAEAAELALRSRSPGFGPAQVAALMQTLFAEDQRRLLERLDHYEYGGEATKDLTEVRPPEQAGARQLITPTHGATFNLPASLRWGNSPIAKTARHRALWFAFTIGAAMLASLSWLIERQIRLPVPTEAPSKRTNPLPVPHPSPPTEVEVAPVKLPTIPAVLNLQAAPWAWVSVDGKPIGETPIRHQEIPAGEHELVFHNPGWPPKTLHITLQAGEVFTRSLSLER